MPTGHIVPTLHGTTFFKSRKLRNPTYLVWVDMVNVADWKELEEMLEHSKNIILVFDVEGTCPRETIIRPALAMAR